MLGFILSIMNDFKKLFDNFGVQYLSGMNGQNHPISAFNINPMATFLPI